MIFLKYLRDFPIFNATFGVDLLLESFTLKEKEHRYSKTNILQL